MCMAVSKNIATAHSSTCYIMINVVTFGIVYNLSLVVDSMHQKCLPHISFQSDPLQVCGLRRRDLWKIGDSPFRAIDAINRYGQEEFCVVPCVAAWSRGAWLRGCVVVSVVDTSPDSYQKLIKSIKRDESRRVPLISVAPSIEPASL
ncbi:hypothetical protein ARMSODRAFT_470268 [Armillaria solidipes]|uniref:Uncharacterized protein n=1 Tax=Armillaria solidipes TaxID=1076256 RepID=A0A2H3BBD8_9AGAR|nr:hypothetical protein ARMSODRAFT_470268 [Armillaria solidipes]